MDKDALASLAFQRGRRDGLGLLSPSLNPYPAGSVEAEQWRQGHESAIQDAARYADAKIKRDKTVPQWERDFNTGADDRGALVYRGRY